MSMLREKIIRDLAAELSDVPPSETLSDAADLARAAVCLVCNRSPSVWRDLTAKLCRLALDPPELGGFPRASLPPDSDIRGPDWS